MKPVALFDYLIKNSSKAGDIVLDSFGGSGTAIRNSSKQGQSVLDLFGGSGSTLIACEQLNRKCFTCELDPRYVDVIINRWEQFTGQKATKIND